MKLSVIAKKSARSVIYAPHVHVLSSGIYFIWVSTIVASPLLLSSIVCASLVWWHFECLAKYEQECGESRVEAPLLAHERQFGQAVLSPRDIVEVIFR